VPPPSANGCNGHPTPPPAETTGRDAATGQFTRGWKGGPGNPFCRQLAARRSAILEAVSREDVIRLAKAMLARALRGDNAAAKILLSYCCGRPAEVVDPDRVGLAEFRMVREFPTLAETYGSHFDPEYAAAYVAAKLIRDNQAHWAAARERLRELAGEDFDLDGEDLADDDPVDDEDDTDDDDTDEDLDTPGGD
jgi:hypothetical protein